MLVSMEERKEFWKYESIRKWYKKTLGEKWITAVLDYFAELDKLDGTTNQRKDMGAYILRMHQIETLLYLEKKGWTKVDGNFIPPTKPE